MEVLMRRARQSDADAINLIFNQAIEDGNSNLDIDLKDRQYRQQWLAAHDKRHPVYVGEMDGEVVCWVALSPYSARYTYDLVADLSIYVRRDLRGQGLGTLLLKFIEQQAAEIGYYKIILSVYGGNRAALHAYRRAGYRDVGVFRNHGYHKGKLVDIIYMERLLVPDMEFLKNYYSENYPFYAQHFAREQAEEEAQLRRNGMLPPLEGQPQPEEEYEEVPVEDPSGLPEGIVRFLKSKPRPPQEPVIINHSREDHVAAPSPEAARPGTEEAPAPKETPGDIAAPAEVAPAPKADRSGTEDAPAPKETPEDIPAPAAEIPAPQAEPKPEEQPKPADEKAEPKKKTEKPPRPKREKTGAQTPRTSKPKTSRPKAAREEPKEEDDAPLEGQLNLEDVILSK